MNRHIQGQLWDGGGGCSVVRVLSFTLSAFVGSNRGGTWGRGGTQANLILMLIFVYFIIIFSSCQGGSGCTAGEGRAAGGFDVATGEVCVLDPREIYAAGSGVGRVGGGVLTNQR